MTDRAKEEIAIGSDAPQTDPAHDAYGYAPFAKLIADAVCRTPSPHGLVTAVHGPWGSGKSSVLNFVKHYLRQLPKPEQPTVIDFNPWWFADCDDLAVQFLLQFRSQLHGRAQSLRDIGELLAEYSATIASAVGQITGKQAAAKPLEALLQLMKQKKDVPSLKEKLTEALRNQDRRFVVVMDDIDRLTPSEVRDIFKVIKALADFPQVIYVLAFDRGAVADALHSSLGIDGDAYIEKIVQAPFSLPVVDRVRLHQKLFEDLDRILESQTARNFDQTYWGNVFFDGLDQCIRKPRDIVRVVNSLSVLYPAVAGEVNPVDFIALGFLRVFEPNLYEHIAANLHRFASHPRSSYESNKAQNKSFHDQWLEKIPSERKDQVQALVLRLFPMLRTVWENVGFAGDSASEWHKNLRVCSPEVCAVYFSFGVPQGALGRSDLNQLVQVGSDRAKAIEILKHATQCQSIGGSSLVWEYVERLRDLVDETPSDSVDSILYALFQIGDTLPALDDASRGMLSPRNRSRLLWLIDALLSRLVPEKRVSILEFQFADSKAIGLLVNMAGFMADSNREPDKVRRGALSDINPSTADRLRRVLVGRLNDLESSEVVALAGLPHVLYRWREWTGNNAVSSCVAAMVDSDELLPLFIEKWLSSAWSETMGDRVARRIPRVDPKSLEPFADLSRLELRIEAMLQRNDLTKDQRLAGKLFVKGMERIRQGKDPDSDHDDD